MKTEYVAKLRKDLILKNGEVFKKDTTGTITFPNPEESKNGTRCFFSYNGETYKIATRKLGIYFGYRIPSETTLYRWMSDCICKSVTGKTVEPDGYGDDNSPSWLLALGLI